MNRAFFALCLAGWVAAAPAATAETVYKVLILGNSYSQGMQPYLQGFSDADPEIALQITAYMPGGYFLEDHAGDATAQGYLTGSAWDFVILQEQSQVGAYAAISSGWWTTFFTNGVTPLTTTAKARGARMVYFQTWARAAGDETTLPNFNDSPREMQDALTYSYSKAGHYFAAKVAPVGEAWWQSLTASPALTLHSSDLSHGNARGYYLAAATIYEVLTGRDSRAVAYTGGLSSSDAATLRANLHALAAQPNLAVDPAVTAGQAFACRTTAAAGAALGTVRATVYTPPPLPTSVRDRNPRIVSYALVSGNTAGCFALDAASGALTVAKSPAAGTYTLGVKVVDSNNWPAQGTVTVTVTVPPTYAVSGRVTRADTGAGVSGVTVTFSGGGGSAVTDATGAYSKAIYEGWSGTATPALGGAVFVPVSRTYTQVAAAQSAQNYSDVRQAYPAGAPWPAGTIECENFDRGGATVAYGDATAANEGGQYRTTEGVDIAADAGAGNGMTVGWTAPGEWLEYTVSVTTAGTYTFETCVAALGAGGQFRIEVDGIDKTGTLSVPNTGAWNAYTVVSKTGVSLAAGTHGVRLAMLANSAGGAVGAFDWWKFTREIPLPGTIQFSSATGAVAESGGSIPITVTRAGGSSGAASVNYATANGTATAGSDYTSASGTLTWADGDAADKTFSVPVANDGAAEGSETFTIALSNAAGAALGSPNVAAVTITESADFTLVTQCEDFNAGGQGAAYNDTTAANLGGKYRPAEGVDIAADANAGNGYTVGWTVPGEWMTYTVTIPAAGAYTFETRVAALGAGGQFRILVDNTDQTGALTIPNTGAWNVYTTVSKTGVSLSAGAHTIRLAMVANAAGGAVGAFDGFKITNVVPAQPIYPSGTAWSVPGTIECENFNQGGAGAAYSDTTAGNAGGKYRTAEAVDIAADAGAGNGYTVGWTAPGEWLQYTIAVGTAGTYTLDTRVAALGTGGQFRIEVDGADKTGALTIPNTGAWNAYSVVSQTGVSLAAGTHVVRLVLMANTSAGAVGAFDWIRFTLTAAASPEPVSLPVVAALAAAPPAPVLTGRPVAGLADVRSSEDARQPDAGWAVADGDPSTLWQGAPEAQGWWLVLTFDHPRRLLDVQVDWAGEKGPLRCFRSLDAETWTEFAPPVDGDPVWLNYLWLVFPADGPPPSVRGIVLTPDE